MFRTSAATAAAAGWQLDFRSASGVHQRLPGFRQRSERRDYIGVLQVGGRAVNALGQGKGQAHDQMFVLVKELVSNFPPAEKDRRGLRSAMPRASHVHAPAAGRRSRWDSRA